MGRSARSTPTWFEPDFQFDQTPDGRLKLLNVVDEFTPRDARHRHRGERFIDADDVVVADWCTFNGIGTVFNDPGSQPAERVIESFRVSLRDELLNPIALSCSPVYRQFPEQSASVGFGASARLRRTCLSTLDRKRLARPLVRWCPFLLRN
jgi:hypothetical protein